MSRVRGKDTTPELYLRKQLWAEGFRYRLHLKLPGKPDIILPKYKAAIFVHGCFWHHHEGCPKSKLPDTRTRFWSSKIAANAERDKQNIANLKKAGWRIAVVWECCIKNQNGKSSTVESLISWLSTDSKLFESTK